MTEKTTPQLAQEARTTTNCERQLALARLPNPIVRRALKENPSLCQAAQEAINATTAQQQKTAQQISDILEN